MPSEQAIGFADKNTLQPARIWKCSFPNELRFRRILCATRGQAKTGDTFHPQISPKSHFSYFWLIPLGILCNFIPIIYGWIAGLRGGKTVQAFNMINFWSTTSVALRCPLFRALSARPVLWQRAFLMRVIPSCAPERRIRSPKPQRAVRKVQRCGVFEAHVFKLSDGHLHRDGCIGGLRTHGSESRLKHHGCGGGREPLSRNAHDRRGG